MILIADSGSTKTDWLFAEDASKVERRQTPGINPVHMSEDEVVTVISALDCTRSPHAVYFYGAGCIDLFKTKVANALGRLFPDADISVESDLLGAARAVCGHRRGIACILGTGSNSCLFDGEKILDNTPPLGYILGDEGSGTHIGKSFLNALFKGRLSEKLRDDYLSRTGLSYPEIINKVYRAPLANRYLASCSVYVAEILARADQWPDDSEVLRKMVAGCFSEFLQKNVARYENAPEEPVGFIGSIAYHYRDILKEVADGLGYRISTIEKSPAEGMLSYHI
jgi:N-acetylglucosamine kinase-like BadF-type ATPase